MKKLLLSVTVSLLFLFSFNYGDKAIAYDKKSLVERFTNCSCGPCATINNAWYNATTASLLDSGVITHIIYNVDWPSATDPMHLLNAAENNTRRRYYGVNAVPWIEINGTTIATNQAAVLNAITSGNSEYAPFNIILTTEVFSNNVINVHVKIIRDPGDNTTFGTTKLRVALTEKRVEFVSPPGSNGERIFYSVCRKMLTDAFGSSFTIPAPGDSTELDLLYIPTTEFLQSVNFDSLNVVAFIQDDDSKDVYQSAMADQLIPSNNVNAAFQVEENFGASPFVINFSDFSTATSTTNIISWEWDFDNNGTIDSNDPEPTWTYNNEQSYTVKLTVSDGSQQDTRILTDYITVLGAVSDILVVNGISYTTYSAEMEDFYNNSACFGNHQVDLWDLFGDQNFDYSANPDIQQIVLENQAISNSILNLYGTVIWIGNSYAGDLALYDPSQVLGYIGQGGNFLLASRQGADFFSTELRNYCDITSFSGLSALTQLIALDDSLVNVPAAGTNDRNQFALLDAGSEAVPIFDDNVGTNFVAGFRIQKQDEGAFIYIAGRPYRFDNTALFHNYNHIINYWMPFSSMSVLSPNGGEIWVVGETEDITWTDVNVNDVKVELSTDNGTSWSTIVESTPNTGTYSWTVASQDSSDECLIRITNVANGNVYDVSDDVFTLDIISTVEEDLETIPSEFELSLNYPNPFNPSTKIKYAVPEESPVSIKVFDLTGREVATLVDEIKQPGSYELTFEAGKYASGVYIYQMISGDFVQVKKMSLLK
jgi:PKD repeat protein